MKQKKIKIEDSWFKVLENEFDKEYFMSLKQYIRKQYSSKIIFPHPKNIFNAYNLTSFYKVKVVILGQDPYHGPNQAHGLCFSVNKGIKVPPSLMNIFKELKNDLSVPISDHGCLEKWANQGVFLLNNVLTVESGKANSHKHCGWSIFTDKTIQTLSNLRNGIVFLLWGKYAHEKEKLIDSSKHYILKAAHPSPLSAHNGFFGCKHFSKTNNYLKSIEKKEIRWNLT